MAICLTVMMGRLGGTVGVNMVALLIEDHCEITFGLAVAVLLACALMSFFIPGISDGKKTTYSLENVEDRCEQPAALKKGEDKLVLQP